MQCQTLAGTSDSGRIAGEPDDKIHFSATVSLVEALRECTPSYFNHECNVNRFNARNSAYGAGPLAFYEIIAKWRAEGSLAGLELS
jgi:hypothetical protein